ncbi:hypothetical protein ACNPQM_34965 [Streptomyces sp. NPDC056231]|uniref:hypothetical protein n=1 Tax=Streptomyces sp. NPDC056231 TaxID=3345755 RepID=UPI003AAECF9D
MQSSHAAAAVSSAFDDPNLIAYGGLEPVVRLAERCGLPTLAGEHIRLPASKDGTGAFPAAKVMSLVGGMAAGADSIEDMHRLRHGAMGCLFFGVHHSGGGPYLASSAAVPRPTVVSSRC